MPTILELTPTDGLTEGQSVEITIRPKDSAGADITLSSLALKYKNGETTTTKALSDFTEDEDDDGPLYFFRFVVGAGKTTIEMSGAGTVGGSSAVITGKAVFVAQPLNLI